MAHIACLVQCYLWHPSGFLKPQLEAEDFHLILTQHTATCQGWAVALGSAQSAGHLRREVASAPSALPSQRPGALGKGLPPFPMQGIYVSQRLGKLAMHRE